MPPKLRDVCGSCSARICDKQNFLACAGDCKRIFHCDCVNVGPGEYEVLMQSGKSAYKCNNCTRRHRTSSKDGYDSDTFSEDPEEVVSATKTGITGEGSIHRVVECCMNTIAIKMEVLTAVVKCIREENKDLRSEVFDLKRKLLERHTTPVPPRVQYSSVTAESNTAVLPRQSSSSSAAAPRGILPAVDAQVRQINSNGRDSSQAAGQRESQGQGEHLSTTEVPDGFTIVKRRRRTKPVVGTGKASKVGVISRPRKAALFVSRLAPATTASDVILLVEPLLKGNPICCSKMKTKYVTYSSFHVEVNQDSFELINGPEVWPDGCRNRSCIFHPFFGRLDVSRTSTSENNHTKMNDGDT
ncbi:unnamed protein product [Ixodes pacificus]